MEKRKEELKEPKEPATVASGSSLDCAFSRSTELHRPDKNRDLFLVLQHDKSIDVLVVRRPIGPSARQAVNPSRPKLITFD